MKRFSTIFAPGLVLLFAVFLGGWFLQKGVSQDRNVYFQLRIFDEVVDHVMASFVDPVDRQEVYQAAIHGVLSDLGDPNTSFLPASDADDFRIRMGGEYGGVGLEVVERDGWVTVVTPLPGTPGTRAGIRAGDQIVGVDGQSTEGWDPDRVVDHLRGRPGTEVAVQIRRPGLEEAIPFSVTRATIQLKSVPFALQLEPGIGYVPLLSVSETSFEEVRRAVDSLYALGAHRIIMDLRRNPGGTLDQGIAITDFFLDPGLGVVETRGRASDQNEIFTASREQTHPDLALVVLVDERSASASEIIAGALQDHDRAVVVGAPTWGKGSVQTLFPLTGGNILRLTTARWYTPVGRSINKDREDQIASMERSALTLTGFLATLPDTVAKPVYHTDSGRRVLGGGGIIPDILVMADTLTTQEMAAIQELDRFGGTFQTAVFNFAVRFLQAHSDPDPEFSLNEGDLRGFAQELSEMGVSLPDSAFRRLERFIRFHLEREIALQAWGEAGEFRRMMDSDRGLERALDLLRESGSTARLLQLAAQPERSDWAPVPLVAEPETQGAAASDQAREPEGS